MNLFSSAQASPSPKSGKRPEEGIGTDWPEETGTDSKPDADKPNQQDRDEHGETADCSEPARPLIDQDVAGSVNAAVHETDE